jgi:HD-GYP domain-containing protein (c-di-GMP phosphodiesterase class II)
MAAPMHDAGKIVIPDAILQKPGRLTAEEFEIMKIHAGKGGQIVKETFTNLGDEEYEKIVYEVARHHHEK